MICELCSNCQTYGVDKELCKIVCTKHGKISIHETNAARFQCQDYAEPEPYVAPPKDNVMIVLTESGRDIIVRDETIHSLDDMRKRIKPCRMNEYVNFGAMDFRKCDIATFSYLGD